MLLAYALRRLLWTVPLLFLVLFVTFFLMRGIGGSPFRLESGGLPRSLQVQLTNFYSLDEPWYVEFGGYLRHVATLDFGPSLVDRETTVDQVIEERVPVSLELALWASAIAVPLGLALGLASAARRGTLADVAVTSFATLLLVVPVFLFTEVLSTYFLGAWGLVPAGWAGWETKVLPALTLALAPAGYIARLTRGAAVEALANDYVRTARAKGLRARRVLLAHVLPNSLVPVLAAAVPTLALLITASFFVEGAFGVPGAAGYFVSAAQTRDYPMVMGLTTVLAALVIAANLLADVAAAAIDPRIREGER